MEGREDREYRRELVKATNRIADALDKLASDPEVEIQAGPAICPHCGTLNPEITVLPSPGSGNMEEYVLEAECHNCNHRFYGFVESWSVYRFREQLLAEIQERAEQNSNAE